jgi:poly-gamma-glutamate synthesis protein (capsule biosynthesis protein)
MRPRLLAAPLALILLLGCQAKGQAPAPAPPPRLRLLAVGDIMMHADVKQAASQADGGFQELWKDLLPAFHEADLVFGNLETPVAPETGAPGRPFQFNAPAGLPAALKASGFSILSTANNHAFDQGHRGLVETLDRVADAGLAPLGSGEDKEEAERPVILVRKGLRIGFLGCADIFNADLDVSPGRPWVRKLDLASLAASIKALRPKVDAVVVSIHWGIEERHDPTTRQREAAAALVAAGADLILGHHPHVIQPVAWVEAGGRKGLVAYSLGNFISNQNRVYRGGDPLKEGDERDELMLDVTFEGSRIVAVKAVPLWVDNNWRERRAGQASRREIRVRRQQDLERRKHVASIAGPLAAD